MGIKAGAPRTEPVDVLEAGDGCGRRMGWGLPSWLVKTTDGRRGGAYSRRVRRHRQTGRSKVRLGSRILIILPRPTSDLLNPVAV